MSTEKKTQHKDIRDAKAFKAVGQGVEKVGKIKFISEFKDFISKGNVMDMAVGMIVGAAFTAIVTSLVNNILIRGPAVWCRGISVPAAHWRQVFPYHAH